MQGAVCEKDGLPLTEEFKKLMLESDKEMARRLNEEEYRLAEDHLKALQLQYEEY